jgi:hypothetical protein
MSSVAVSRRMALCDVIIARSPPCCNINTMPRLTRCCQLVVAVALLSCLLACVASEQPAAPASGDQIKGSIDQLNPQSHMPPHLTCCSCW